MFWFLLFAVCVATACGAAEEERFLTVEFDVTPGGQVHSFSKSLYTFTCTFTYAAQGGTNEKWHLSLGASDDSAVYSCSIWRPQGKSYLFFTQFKVETIGGTIEFADAFSKAIDGEKEVPLQQDEYIIRENSVSHNPGPFRAELSKLMVVARAHHEEL